MIGEVKRWQNPDAPFTIECVRSARGPLYYVKMPRKGFRIVRDAKGQQRLKRVSK